MKMNSNFRKNKFSRGFTLVEALIAAFLSSVLIYMLYSVFNTTSKTFTVLNHRTEVYQNGRTILEQITRTVKGAISYVSPANANCFFILNAGTNDAWVPAGSNPIGHKLFFVAPWRTNDANQVLDFCEFGYYLSSGSNLAYDGDNVLRMNVESDANNNADWNYRTALTTWPSVNAPYNELGFGVRKFEVEWNNTTTTNPGDWNNPTAGNEYTTLNNVPRAIRITIRVIDPDDAKKYAGMGPELDKVTSEFSTIVSLVNHL